MRNANATGLGYSLGALLLSLLAVGCTDLTEILVVVQSNLAVPGQMDGIRVEVTGSETMTATGSLSGADGQPLPRTVGIVRSGGSNGPIQVRAVGTLGGADVVQSTAEIYFITGQTRVLEMVLSRICAGRSCPAGQTCNPNGDCVPNAINANDLPEYMGSVPPFDAGVCPPEECDDVDNDCDGRVDEGFMLQSNPNSCGECGRVCDFVNATAGCASGNCVIAMCDAGFADCNSDQGDGCETPTRTLTDCGACGVPCEAPGGTPDCSSGTCTIAMCDAGLGDCNMDITDGCEAPTNTLTDCGGCGVPCDLPGATETCDSGTCTFVACEPGFDDCDMDTTNGCETPLDTLTDCGACGVPCMIANGTGTCASGTCEVATCDADQGDCNMDPSDGCEESLRFNDMFCGDCMTACLPTERCQNGTCR